MMFRILVVAIISGERGTRNVTVLSRKELLKTCFRLLKSGAEYIEYFEY